MAIKHLVLNTKTGKPELKTFKSEQAYREYRQKPEQKKWQLDIDLKVHAESANKKLKQLERKGLTNSPAYKQAQHQIHLITGDTNATRFPTAAKDTATAQRAVQAAFKFEKYETATPGGYNRVQKRARKGFGKALGENVSQKQYDIITEAAEVLKEMYGAFVPASSEMYGSLVDMSDTKKFTDEDIREFAFELQEAIDNSPQIVSEYTRHLLSVGLDEFAHGKRPNARKLVNDVLEREEKRLEEYTRRVRGDEFPYK